MMRFVSLVALSAFAVACSSSDHPPAAATDGTSLPPVGTGSSADGGAGGSDDGGGGGGGGTDGSTTQPGQYGPEQCQNVPQNSGDVSQDQVAQAPPTPGGGTIAAGTYVLTSWTTYTGVGGATGPTGEVAKVTLIVTSDLFRFAETEDGQPLPSHAEQYTVAGTLISSTEVCPETRVRERDYTVSGNTLTLYNTANTVQVFTKQ